MLHNLKNQELLQNCKVQVQLEKAATSKVLDYLTEIARRRLWIQEGYHQSIHTPGRKDYPRAFS